MAHAVKLLAWLEAVYPGEYAALMTAGRLPSVMALLFAWMNQEDAMDLVGHCLGNYRLVRLLGEGGAAQVYLAEHQVYDFRS